MTRPLDTPQLAAVLATLATGAAFLTGCETRGACVSVHNFTGSSDTIYSCDEDELIDYCEDSSGTNVEGDPFTISASFHSDQTCSTVGYPYECGYEWLSNAACDDRVPPGEGSSSGGSGSESGGCGSSSYGGPYYDDYQVESQCEALWAYGCSAEATEAICEILDQWEANGEPNVCPYC